MWAKTAEGRRKRLRWDSFDFNTKEHFQQRINTKQARIDRRSILPPSFIPRPHPLPSPLLLPRLASLAHFILLSPSFSCPAPQPTTSGVCGVGAPRRTPHLSSTPPPARGDLGARRGVAHPHPPYSLTNQDQFHFRQITITPPQSSHLLTVIRNYLRGPNDSTWVVYKQENPLVLLDGHKGVWGHGV